MSKILTLQQTLDTYGIPGDISNHAVVSTPFPLLLDWDTTKSVSKITCHKKIVPNLTAVFGELLAHYGQTKINELGINQYAGCFNHRPKRGKETQYAAAIERGDLQEAYSYLSQHSWAIAIDLDADRNKLRENKTTARFAREEYKKMIEIFYKNGFLSYGVEFDFDWMHFEIAS
jgi:hypothetical protein